MLQLVRNSVCVSMNEECLFAVSENACLLFHSEARRERRDDPTVRDREVILHRRFLSFALSENACLLFQNEAQRLRDRRRRADPAVREREVSLPVP